MDNKNKILANIEKYAVTYLFIAPSILFIIVSGLDFNYVASQLLLRLNRQVQEEAERLRDRSGTDHPDRCRNGYQLCYYDRSDGCADRSALNDQLGHLRRAGHSAGRGDHASARRLLRVPDR